MRQLLLATVLISVLSAQQPADPGTSYRFRIDQPTAAQRQALEQAFDVQGPSCANASTTGPIEVIVMPEELAAFRAIAPAAREIGRGEPFFDVRLAWQAQSPVDIDPLYYTVAEVEQAIDQLAAQYPALARKIDLTALPGGVRTHENRSIFALKVSDNVAIDEDEPGIVLAAQHHARELNSTVVVIEAMRSVLSGYATDPALRALVDGHELYFVPTVNPDGSNYVWTADNNWRKNRRYNGGTSYGVDPNRNYPFLWGLCGSSTTTSSQIYRGPSPGSEPEVRTMRNLMALVRPEIYLDFHSYGREVLHMWAPCATVSPTMDAFQQHYVDALRAPMGYSFRDPSASGEAPEDHYASGGTLSFLTEVCTSVQGFQPPYSQALAEAGIVWPGIRSAVTTWAPAVRGHVRSTYLLQPLEATITIAPSILNHGEVTKSRARDGRYGLWLPLGTWQITYAAPGHQSRTTTVTVTSYDSPQAIEVELDPLFTAPAIAKSGSERIGSTVTLTYGSPGDAGQACLIGWSLGTSPGFALGGLRVIPLNPDFLFEAAMRGTSVLSPTWGVLDGAGTHQALLQIPNMPSLIGFTTYFAGITFDPSYSRTVEKFSPAIGVTPVP
ncbi:MAG: hypothetical protein Fur0037_01520 [Planctomycetota bacterium]